MLDIRLNRDLQAVLFVDIDHSGGGITVAGQVITCSSGWLLKTALVMAVCYIRIK
jgi:hypothetical protein